MIRSVRTALLGLLVSCAACVTPTEVVVHVDATDAARAASSTLRVRVVSLVSDSESGSDFTRTTATDELPTAVTVHARVKDADRRFRVLAELLDASGNAVARRELQSGFVEGERRALYMLLDVGANAGLGCDDRQTWSGTECTGACVDKPEPWRDFDGRPTPSGPCDFTCADADDGARCTDGGRDGRCWNGSCCLGCFDGVACRPGQAADACGWGGEECTACAPDPPCGDTCTASPGTTSYACRPAMPASALATGEHHTCVTAPAGVYCFGANDAGQLGDGTTEPTHVPRLVRGSRLGSLTAGARFTCGLNLQNRLICWGSRDHAELGDGFGDPQLAPPSDAEVNATDSQQLSAVDAGRDHTCAIDVEGRLFCWGQNAHQQSGRPEGVQIEPARSEVNPSLRFAFVSAGTKHTCAIDTAGTLYCWGGCCGDDMERNPELATIVPSTTRALDGGVGVDGGVEQVAYEPREAGMGFRFVAAGRFGTCVIDTDDEAWCSGAAKTSVPEFVGTDLLPLWPLPVGGPVRSVEQGHWDRICVIRSEDMSIACADDDTWVDSDDRRQTLFPTYSRWKAVASGVNHICAIRESGALYCWASDAGTPFAENDVGQVGVESPTLGVLYRVCLPPP